MSSQWVPKAAPVQHSVHILLRFILREPQSTTGNFLGNVGEGEGADWGLVFIRDRVLRANNLLRIAIAI